MNKKVKKPKSIDVEKVDLDRMEIQTTDLPGLIEYAHSLGGFAIVPTEQKVIKGQAMQAMQEQTQKHMDQIFEQMKLLAEQAQKLKDRVEVSEQIYTADLKFQPVIGKTYYLYQKEDQSKVLSMIAPEEWGRSKKFAICLAKVQLLADHTWKIIQRYDDTKKT